MTDTTYSSSLKNQFLIAMPHMEASGFENTVTYICEHDKKGAMGLVINRPTGISLKEILHQMNIDTDTGNQDMQPIYVGGPLQTDRGFILHGKKRDWQSTISVSAAISLTTSRDILASIAKNEGPEDCIVTLGYVGWGMGQLERECANNYWLTVPADADIIFHTPSEERLEAAARLLGISLDQISSYAGHA